MARYSLGLWVRADFTGRPALDIRTSAIARVRLLSVGCATTGAVGTSGTFTFGLGRPAAIGTPNVLWPLICEDPNSRQFSQSRIGTSWTVEPTSPVTFLRRWTTPVAAGDEVLMQFGRGIVIPPSSSLVLWFIAASNATPFTANMVLEE